MGVTKFENIRQGDLPALAKKMIDLYPQTSVWAFYGQMGAGKTTFIQSFCEILEVKEDVLSPTFAIVNEYTTAKGEPVFHFDFYRIKTLEEAYDIGYEEYFFSNFYCLVEWPEKIEELLLFPHIKVEIQVVDENTRTFVIQGTGEEYQ